MQILTDLELPHLDLIVKSIQLDFDDIQLYFCYSSGFQRATTIIEDYHFFLLFDL